jgi:hypothetical protein
MTAKGYSNEIYVNGFIYGQMGIGIHTGNDCIVLHCNYIYFLNEYIFLKEDKIDRKRNISSKEIVHSNMMSIGAIVRLLIRKGLVTVQILNK